MSAQPAVTPDGSQAPKGLTAPAPISQLMGELVIDLLETTGLIPEAKFEVLREKAKHLRETMPPAPEYAMVLEDAKEPRSPHVFIRGNPGNLYRL